MLVAKALRSMLTPCVDRNGVTFLTWCVRGPCHLEKGLVLCDILLGEGASIDVARNATPIDPFAHGPITAREAMEALMASRSLDEPDVVYARRMGAARHGEEEDPDRCCYRCFCACSLYAKHRFASKSTNASLASFSVSI
jgi:hypothetical protein